MCGIVGYTGAKNAVEVLLEGLSNLEYRGYDSAGISVFEKDGLQTVKTKGRLADLREKLKNYTFTSGCGIGHTRWATHGAPSDVNAHPHVTDRLALVHNGIIENYDQVREFLQGKGYRFVSQTDTETAAKMVDYCYHGDPEAAIREACATLRGAYAFCILFADRPGEIYCLRKDSPLIVALGQGENFVASDMPAVLRFTRSYYLLEEGEIARVTPEGVTVTGPDGKPVAKAVQTATWNIEQAQKGGYAHFMLKEIFEQPDAIRSTMSPRIGQNGLPDFSASNIPADLFRGVTKLNVVACGTAMHAGMIGKALMEKLARLPVEVDMASEFRYRDPVLGPGQLALVISQSGETADSLAALRLCKEAGVPVIAIVNVAGSSIAREADYCIYTYAGPEIAVASTKAYSVQINLMYLLAVSCALQRGTMTEAQARSYLEGLRGTIARVRDALALSEEIKAYAQDLKNVSDLFFIGRGIDYYLALEGSLKLKEVSYIHSEAYAAGELKHGPIALISQNVPVIAMATQRSLLPKMVSNIKEVKARGGHVLLITGQDYDVDTSCCDKIMRLPIGDEAFGPMLGVVVLQLLAYYASIARGCDVDKPRNLAKSVTVE